MSCVQIVMPSLKIHSLKYNLQMLKSGSVNQNCILSIGGLVMRSKKLPVKSAVTLNLSLASSPMFSVILI